MCVLVYGDRTPKDVGWCRFCKAWLCEECRTHYADRARAALRRGLRMGMEEKDREG